MKKSEILYRGHEAVGGLNLVKNKNLNAINHGPLAIGTYHKNLGPGHVGPLFSVFITVIEVNFANA